MLLKTKDRKKLTRLEPGMFMKTKEIVELTRTAHKSLIFYNIRVVAGSQVGEPGMFMKTNEIVELI